MFSKPSTNTRKRETDEDRGGTSSKRKKVQDDSSSWLSYLSSKVKGLLHTQSKAADPKTLKRICGDTPFTGLFLTSDSTVLKCVTPVIDSELFKPEEIKDVTLSSPRCRLQTKQDLINFDIHKRIFGYEFACGDEGTVSFDSHSPRQRANDVGNEKLHCVVYTVIVPLIKISVAERRSKLSTEAFEELCSIEEQVENGENIREKLEEFLKKFGSHVLFGGSNQIGAVFECVIVNEEDEDINEDVMQEIYNLLKNQKHPNADGHHWISASEYLMNTEIPEEELSKYNVRVLSSGKLDEEDLEISAWREKAFDVESLPLIGWTHGTCCKGVWELVKKEDGFLNSDQLADMLRQAWVSLQEEDNPNDNEEEEHISSDSGSDSMELDNEIPSASLTTNEENEDILKTELVTISSEERIRLLRLLELDVFYPGKLTLNEATQVQYNSDQEDNTVSFMSVLQKLIGIDYRCRDAELWQCGATGRPSGAMGRFHSARSQILNPQDVFLLGFKCCDSGLQQVLASKLFLCRLAIPFVIPADDGIPAFSLWPLRNIVIEWAGVSEKSFIKHPMHVVSCLRIGTPSVSKSEVLNNLISSDTPHETFYHRNCSPGTDQRKIASGTIETSHFLPEERRNDIFKQEMILLNLRGNSTVFPKQTQILAKMSSILFIFMDVYDLKRTDIRSQLEDIRKDTAGKIILLLTCMNIPSNQELNEECLKDVDLAFYELVPTFFCGEDAAMKTVNEVTIDLRDAMTNIWRTITINKFSLEQHVRICSDDLKFPVDELSISECVEAKKMADKVISHLLGPNASPNKDMLPLQGQLWSKWSDCLKRKYRPTKSEMNTHTEKEKIQKEMDDIRLAQQDICQEMPQYLTTFIQYSQSLLYSNKETYFFCKWLKLDLDEISRNVLPELRRTCKMKQKAYEDNDDERKAGRLCKEKSAAEKELFDASIGMEHILREIGQVYECLVACEENFKKAPPSWTSDLPKIAAHFLLCGIPLELMSGDPGCVPLVWIKAVIDCLNAYLDHKKLFVLSCIGIQSSGKSTLLNTMFGLDFAVGAGRVTRGIFAQLLEVDRARSTLPFDMVLVLDTEGLRAPERAGENYSNDNALATLVIGLADYTLVNIKGENMNEISSILEIVVHAFLRMREANSFRRQKKQKCMFLHQNVSSVNASEKMGNDHRLLRERLDERIRVVAKRENSTVTSFTQVIEFDSDKHVQYFSDLWKGDPPMAPTNPGYAATSKKVKDRILAEATQCRSLKDLSSSLTDQWAAILADDFVYSFRNSLSVKAYIQMEIKYSGLTRSFESQLLEWVTKDCRAKVLKSDTETELHNCISRLNQDLERKARILSADHRKQFETFIEESDCKEMMAEWKQDKLNAMKAHNSLTIGQLSETIEGYKKNRKVDLQQITYQPTLENEMMKKATELAEHWKGKHLTESQCDEEFDKMWKKWSKEFASDSNPYREDIVQQVESILFQEFPDHIYLLKQEWLNFPLVSGSTGLEGRQLEDSLNQRDINDSFYAERRYYWDQPRVKTKSASNKKIVLHFANQVMRKLDSKLDSLFERDMPFQKSIAHDIICTVCKDFEEFNNLSNTNQVLMLTTTFKVRLANHVVRLSIPRFEHMTKDYDSRNGIKAKMDAYKTKIHNLFHNLVRDRKEEVKVADLFCDSINQVLIQSIDADMSRKVVDAVLADVNVKYHFIVKILESLAEKENFRDFMSYIADPMSFASDWIQYFTKEVMFRDRNGSTMYIDAVKEHLQSAKTHILETTKKATKKAERQNAKKLSEWLDGFCTLIPDDLMLQRSSFGPNSLFEKEVDLESFQNIVANRLKDQQSVVQVFEKRSPANLIWTGEPPYVQIMTRLWGCKGKCPFCHEPCQKQEKHADNHHCIQHRPIGCRGTKDRHSRKLITEACTFQVCGTHRFNCNACNNKCRQTEHCNATDDDTFHDWKEYNKYVPNWDIAPDSAGEASQYWQWFMHKFQKDLADYYGVNKPDIPASWRRVTKARAIQSLRVYHS